MRRRDIGLGLFTLITLAASGCPADGDGPLDVSGSIEADEVRVSTTVGGQVADVLATEGQVVAEGDALMRFDTADIELQADQARAAVRMAEAQLALAHAGARPEDIAAARELVKQAEAGESMASADLERVGELEAEGAVTGKQADDARTGHEVAVSRTRAAKQQYNKALKGARPEELEMAEAGVAQTEAVLALAEKKLADCEVTAPLSGTVIHRLVEPGEVSGPGATLFVIQDLSTVRLTVFVPETDIGSVRLGDPVQVFIDSHPGQPFPGVVSRIRDQAEFTPKNVQTKDERVKLVFGVEVELANPDGYLKPGLPADAVIGSVVAG
ncbi:MAG: efflux RND transporter periplasmic adaptor subunit [Myxococcota bacterium]|jgi:HlyD family secretion protein|nr:efflux RND transporter periplasmic adaptor subunit [Myxococcota bacterium]